MDYIQVGISFISSLLPFAYFVYSLGRLQQRIDHMSKRIDEILADNRGVDRRVDEHERSIARHEEAIATLKKKVDL